MNDIRQAPILVAGATGYIGGRLVPRLLRRGYRVRALCRTPAKLSGRPWANHPALEVCRGDLLDRESLLEAMAGCRVAYYLVHSMNPGVSDFAAIDKQAAGNFATAATETGLSSYWISLITPVPAALARPLAEGLRNKVICKDFRLRQILPQRLLSCREAIQLALDHTQHYQVESSWSDAGFLSPSAWPMAGDPGWAGGAEYRQKWRIVLAASAEETWPAVTCIGGTTGWYHANWLWRLRGFLDRLVGGIGLQRGRRCPLQVSPGDALDFWRVSQVEKPRHLQLVAEMKLPGKALLEFRLDEPVPDRCVVQLYARFWPRGLFGRLYWWTVAPLHGYIFKGLLRGIGQSLGKDILEPPEAVKHEPD